MAILLLSCCGRTKEEESSKKKETKPSKATEQTQPDNTACMAQGKEVYSQHCLVCHQMGGGGVSGLNPPLKGTDYVLGDPDSLIAILLKGSNEGLEVNGSTYSNAMPGFSYLTDEQIACVATYIRNSFGNTAGTISAEQVTKGR